MPFYVLDKWTMTPATSAETTFIDVDPVNTGSAPRCPRCGKFLGMLDWLPPHRVKLELSGQPWGDLAFGVSKDILLSERLKALVEQHGIVGFEGFDPVEVVRFTQRGAGRKVKEPPPRYFRVTVKFGRAMLDRERSGVRSRGKVVCPECNYAGDVDRVRKVVLHDEPTPEEDIFIARGLPAAPVCTERFRQFCEEFRVANAILIPAEKYRYAD